MSNHNIDSAATRRRQQQGQENMKSILVHLDASPRAAVRLALAQRLAKQHGAELNVMYGVMSSVPTSPWVAGEAMTAAALVRADQDRAQQARARGVFDKAAEQGELRWLEGGPSPYWSLLQRALYADLLVLGQDDPRDTMTGNLPADLVPASIIDSGRPTLIVPHAGAFETLPSQVMIAWKPTREASRALVAALPWLLLAKRVHITTRLKREDSDIDHVAALKHWLQAQGVTAALQTHDLGPGDVGEQLLSRATHAGAELLVMGCYGHSRMREWALGGASRSVLRAMNLPVLMVH